MKLTLLFLTLIFFSSCGQQNQETTSTRGNVSLSTDSIAKPDSSKKNATQTTRNNGMQQILIEQEMHNDSLRTEILKRKKNKILKESFLQELYIRDVARVVKDSVFVNIPFNLHAIDCGAPDCYQTEVSFSFKLGDALKFPEELQFKEYEWGCVDREARISGVFQLVEQNTKHVIYHSVKYKRTLVLFSTNKEVGTYAYYFTGVEQNRINGQNLYMIMKNYNEDDPTSLVPYNSTILTTNEYENFIEH